MELQLTTWWDNLVMLGLLKDMTNPKCLKKIKTNMKVIAIFDFHHWQLNMCVLIAEKGQYEKKPDDWPDNVMYKPIFLSKDKETGKMVFRTDALCVVWLQKMKL